MDKKALQDIEDTIVSDITDMLNNLEAIKGTAYAHSVKHVAMGVCSVRAIKAMAGGPFIEMISDSLLATCTELGTAAAFGTGVPRSKETSTAYVNDVAMLVLKMHSHEAAVDKALRS